MLMPVILDSMLHAPMGRRACPLDRQRQQLVAAETEGLHQYRQPRPDVADATCVNRDGLAVAGARNPQPRVRCV